MLSKHNHHTLLQGLLLLLLIRIQHKLVVKALGQKRSTCRTVDLIRNNDKTTVSQLEIEDGPINKDIL